MRILMVSEDLPGEQIGGLGKHVVTLANCLLRAGHAVEILGRSDRPPADYAAQIGFEGRFRAGFALARPGWRELQMGVFNPVKRPYLAHQLARAITAHAAQFDVVHYHGHLPLVGLALDAALNFVQTRHDQGSECLTHLRFRAGVVCDNLTPAGCAGCIRQGAGPLRQLVSGMAVHDYRRRAARAFARHKTVFVSDFLRRRFLGAVPDADLARSRVIHNFIDYPRLRAVLAATHAPTPGMLLLAGRIDAGKGFAEFLDAAAGHLPSHASVVVAGDGPQQVVLARRHGGSQVRFLGWQAYPRVLALTARAHLCVVPSLCEEACSTTVLEALALGRPCIALARGGTPELARYALYPGQLGLANDMAALVALARRHLDAPVIAPTPAVAFGADAARLLPSFLELYAEPANLHDRHLHPRQRRHAG